MGGALEGSTGKLIEIYAEKFGDSAAQELLEIGADRLIEDLKQPTPDLTGVYREALRSSLPKVHELKNGDFDDWFANWNHCLATQVPLDLPALDQGRLVPEKLDAIFFHTLELLDAQGSAIRSKTTSIRLKLRSIPEALVSELNQRLPKPLIEEIDSLIVSPEYEEVWKRLQLIFQDHLNKALGRIDETTRMIDQKIGVLPQIARDVASLLRMAKSESRKPRSLPGKPKRCMGDLEIGSSRVHGKKGRHLGPAASSLGTI